MKLLKITLVLTMVAITSISFANDNSKREMRKQRKEFRKKIRQASVDTTNTYVSRPKFSNKTY